MARGRISDAARRRDEDRHRPYTSACKLLHPRYYPGESTDPHAWLASVAWAERMLMTHEQRWAIWSPKDSLTDETEDVSSTT